MTSRPYIEFRKEEVGPNVTKCHVISSDLKGILHFDTATNHYSCDLQGPNGKIKETFDNIPDLKKAVGDFIRVQMTDIEDVPSLAHYLN
jgi:hypothetical protein